MKHLQAAFYFAGLLLPSSIAFSQTKPSGIPESAVPFNGHWYAVFDRLTDDKGRMLWHEAHEAAIERGGHLVCIDSAGEWEFIAKLLENGPHNHIWTGGYYSAENGWVWINGRSIDESRLNNPDNRKDWLRIFANNNKDIDFHYGGRKSTEPAGGFIVEYAPDEAVALTLPDGSKSVAMNGTETNSTSQTAEATGTFNGHRYELATALDGVPEANGLTWTEASEFAQKRGGYLACLETADEVAFIMEFTEHRPDLTLWLGGYAETDSNTGKSNWKWVNGSPFNKNEIPIRSTISAETRMIILREVRGNNRNLAVRDAPKRSVHGFVIEYSASSPKMTTTSSPSKPVGGPPVIQRNQTKVNGLLVMSIGSSQAGSASPMSLIALPGDPEEPSTLKFNQEVGESMEIALAEVKKFITLRYDAWPKGRNLEISFENKYNPKDGPSAAVACALLLESAISGDELDSRFAVTGDMNADGSVQPIGGVEAKIRGATNRDCSHIALPRKNIDAVFDTVLMHGIQHVMDIQVFSISNFEEAHALALKEKPDATKKAIDDFTTIQSLYHNNPGAFRQALKHPKVVERLNSIISSAPNHISASVLLAYIYDRSPKSLSIHGSFAFIDKNTYQIVDVIEDGKVAELNDFDQDQVAEAVSLLKRNKLKLDERTWKWADSLMRWGELMREYQTNRPKAVSNLNKLIDSINMAGREAREQREQLLENPEVMEELLD